MSREEIISRMMDSGDGTWMRSVLSAMSDADLGAAFIASLAATPSLAEAMINAFPKGIEESTKDWLINTATS